MALIRFRRGNPSGPDIDHDPLLRYSGGTFHMKNAMLTSGGGDSFMVDDSNTALIAALDADPRVQRGGGGGSEGPNVSPQAGVTPVVVVADTNGNYGGRPSAPVVFWIGPSAPAGKANDGDLWFNSSNFITA